MKNKLLLITILLTACAPQDDKLTIVAKDGKDGIDGVNGINCYSESVPGGVKIMCPDSPPAIIYNGVNGINGSGIHSIHIPCKNNIVQGMEVFLKLSNNKYIAVYDGGQNLDRLSLLSPSNTTYQTTDGRSCYVIFSNDGVKSCLGNGCTPDLSNTEVEVL